ncbi:hypothetical protein QR680_014147 [Steinernema hermaphroditum]|uniref:non-specific serine/threonine protein kinase n=1 Tax=Steinernema hermaphroditum TaxID=289476 RepID=A0AA39IAG7_9BILA|nr:hypothetical protein QR680_014147 [Steinernema hermaphroditum]
MPTVTDVLVDLVPGKVINNRWKIEGKLGEGCCGAVFKVHDINHTNVKAALKVEPNEESINVLKKEASVLKQLQVRQHTMRLVYSGRRELYSYVVMSLLGRSLNDIRREIEGVYMTAGTLHEIGYVHRDIKPANMVTGRLGYQRRIIYLIDYGMARNYAVWEDGKPRIRRSRDNVLLRGTVRFCAPTVHDRREQGRRDDIWSFLYMLVELHVGLPWPGKPEDKVEQMKRETTDAELLADCPKEWMEVMTHIHTLAYETRPNYRMIYNCFMATMARLNVTFDDPYDWETPADLEKLPPKMSMKSALNSTKKNAEKDRSDLGTIMSKVGGESAYVYPTTVAAEFDKDDIRL